MPHGSLSRGPLRFFPIQLDQLQENTSVPKKGEIIFSVWEGFIRRNMISIQLKGNQETVPMGTESGLVSQNMRNLERDKRKNWKKNHASSD